MFALRCSRSFIDPNRIEAKVELQSGLVLTFQGETGAAIYLNSLNIRISDNNEMAIQPIAKSHAKKV